MFPDIPKITVRIISYNQEVVICRALDSLIAQKDYLYEICINDDCSSDETYNVLLDYQRRFPDLVKPFRNDHNLGIFQNIEASWKLITGDIVYNMAGDDEAGEGYFKAIIDYIKNEKIDYLNELFCIYGDYKVINPDGRSFIFTNRMASSHDALKLKVRNLLSNRSACYSKKVLDKFEKVSSGHSFNAEMIQDCQLALFAEKNCYIPVIGNIYYAGIGVSSHMSKEEQRENIFEGYQRLTDFVTSHGHPFDKKDLAFISFLKAYRAQNYVQAIKYYLASIDLSLGIRGFSLDRILFVLKKRTTFH